MIQVPPEHKSATIAFSTLRDRRIWPLYYAFILSSLYKERIKGNGMASAESQQQFKRVHSSFSLISTSSSSV
jgi:hypothetical protein